MKKNKTNNLKYFKLFKPIAELNRLTLNAKLVAMYIYNLHSFGRTCTASNNYMSKVLNISSSSVDEAIKSLRNIRLINDFRNDDNKKDYIEVCRPNICDEYHYKFYSTILNSDLKTRAKFLLTYILSYHKNGQNCYSSNANILDDIGLSKDAVNYANKELQSKKLIVILNPGKPQRELRIPLGNDPLVKLNILTKKREAEKREQTKKKENPSSQKLVSFNPENSTKFPENSIKLPENRLGLPEFSDNNKSNKTINEIKNNRNNKKIEKIKTNNKSLINSFNSIIDIGNKKNDKEASNFNSPENNTQMKISLKDSQPLGELTVKSNSNITIDDIIKNISKIDYEQMKESISQFLQLGEISTGETLTSDFYNLLNEIGDLSNFLSEEGKILITSNYLSENGEILPSLNFSNYRKYFLVNNSGKITNINLPQTPLWYDERMFQYVEFKFTRMNNVKCSNINSSNGLFLTKVKSGEINSNSKDYNKELLKGLDRFIIPTIESGTQIINGNDILSSS